MGLHAFGEANAREDVFAYEGIGFESSPCHLFWGRYIEPFLEDLATSEIKAAVATAKERDVDGKAVLLEVSGMLKAGCEKIFQEMAIIDQRLRGKGYPNSVHRRSIDNELAMMSDFIDQHVNGEIAMWKSKSALEEWCNRNKFWVWAIPIAASIAAAIAKLL